ncbi:unnamed protein product [Amoebophrya sp. A120]|nr:unnamed protein product [Amoebophrya sp. A120]|eukprot:GSA120T00015471001.1
MWRVCSSFILFATPAVAFLGEQYRWSSTQITKGSGQYYDGDQNQDVGEGSDLQLNCTKLFNAAPNHWIEHGNADGIPAPGGWQQGFRDDQNKKKQGGLKRLTRSDLTNGQFSAFGVTYPNRDSAFTFDECVSACLWDLEASVERADKTQSEPAEVGCEGIVYANGGDDEGHCWLKRKACCESENEQSGLDRTFSPVPALAGDPLTALPRISVRIDDECKQTLRAGLGPFFTLAKKDDFMPSYSGLFRLYVPKTSGVAANKECTMYEDVGVERKTASDAFAVLPLPQQVFALKDATNTAAVGNFITTAEGCFEWCFRSSKCVAFTLLPNTFAEYSDSDPKITEVSSEPYACSVSSEISACVPATLYGPLRCQLYSSLKRSPQEKYEWGENGPKGSVGMILGDSNPDKTLASKCRRQLMSAVIRAQPGNKNMVKLDGHYFQGLPEGYVFPPEQYDSGKNSYTPGYSNYGRYDCYTTHHDINFDEWHGAASWSRRRGGDANDRRRSDGNRRRHGHRRRGTWDDGGLTKADLGTSAFRLSEQPLGPLTPGNVRTECAKVCTQLVPRCVGFTYMDAQKDYRQQADVQPESKYGLLDNNKMATMEAMLGGTEDGMETHTARPGTPCAPCLENHAHTCKEGCDKMGTTWTHTELRAQEEERRGTYCCIVYQGLNPGKMKLESERRRHTNPETGSGDDGSANRRREDKCRRINREAPYENEDWTENPDLEGIGYPPESADPIPCKAPSRRRQHQVFPVSGHWWSYLRDLDFVRGHILNPDEARYGQRFLAQSEAGARTATDDPNLQLPARPYVVQYGTWGSCEVFTDPDFEFRKIPKTLSPRPGLVESVYQAGGEPDSVEADKECALQCFREVACNAFARPIADVTCCVLFELALYDPSGKSNQVLGEEIKQLKDVDGNPKTDAGGNELKETVTTGDVDFVDPPAFIYDDNLDKVSGPFALANREVVIGARYTARLFKLGYEDLGGVEMQPFDPSSGMVNHRDPARKNYDANHIYNGSPDIGCVRLSNTDIRPTPGISRHFTYGSAQDKALDGGGGNGRRRYHNPMQYRVGFNDLLEDSANLDDWKRASIMAADVGAHKKRTMDSSDTNPNYKTSADETDVFGKGLLETGGYTDTGDNDQLVEAANGVCVSYRMCFALCAAFKDCFGFVYDRNAHMPGGHPYDYKGIAVDGSDFDSGGQGDHTIPPAELNRGDGREAPNFRPEDMQTYGGDPVCGGNMDQDKFGNETRSCYFLGQEFADYTNWPVGHDDQRESDNLSTACPEGQQTDSSNQFCYAFNEATDSSVDPDGDPDADCPTCKFKDDTEWANGSAAPWNNDRDDRTRLQFKHTGNDGKPTYKSATAEPSDFGLLYQNYAENFDTLIMTPTCRNAAQNHAQLSLLIDKVIDANTDATGVVQTTLAT